MTRGRQLALLIAFTLALHLPFLDQPPQADEVNYLDMAAHVFAQPLAPLNFTYVFQGQVFSMSGHPHPPLNAWMLAAIWAVWGQFSPPVFHAVYLVFALGVSLGAYVLAAQFTERPLWVALLIATAPAVQVAGNSLETDAATLAFLLCGAACFRARRFATAGVLLSLACFSGLQAFPVVAILIAEYWLRRERAPRAALAAAAAPVLLFIAWQASQWLLTREVPAALLAGHVRGPLFGRIELKLANAAALVQHLAILIVPFPVAPRGLALLAGSGVAWWVASYPWWERALVLLWTAVGVQGLIWLWLRRKTEPWLAAWCFLYFAFALLAFFAGAARYLLPMAAPLVILLVRECRQRWWLPLALGVNVALGLSLSHANYELAQAHARVARPPGSGVFLVNGEWGFRHTMTRAGGRMIEPRSVPQPGEWLVTSDLALGGRFGSLAEALAVPVETQDLTVRSPFRILDRYAHSGYFSAAFGLLPFSFSWQPMDRITYSRTSPWWRLPEWQVTAFNGRTVLLPPSGRDVTIEFSPGASTLHFRLFARGTGPARFTIRDPQGRMLFEKQVQPAQEDLWEEHTLVLKGARAAVLRIDADSVRAGWGELVDY